MSHDYDDSNDVLIFILVIIGIVVSYFSLMFFLDPSNRYQDPITIINQQPTSQPIVLPTVRTISPDSGGTM
jgi:hypothetical protein